ncbi:hypothetical protein RhiirA4_476101 [Rhizophagus irregularis]|uniref:Protein kinase domain-containing protein n=1 Tax=Rhizophagus irregularis TaxID=588596 RepID=A0A2I1HB61_9GLOM|nr:hypothetical protein RhiirA4_476101 [Rhizophagus irregularis]
MQLKINNYWTHIIIEWIPYDQFTDIKKIEKVDDNAAISYSAIWKNGPLYYRYNKKEWIRNPNKKVILNCLALDVEKFLNKVNKYSNIYGISQNPNTKDYILVLQNRNCKRCGKSYNDLENKWCKICEINYIQKKFTNWNENEKIDNFIQEKQIKINDINKFFNEANNYNDLYGMSQNPNTNDYILVLQDDQYCNKCCKPYSNLEKKFCKSCQINYIQNNLTNWSRNQKINDFIQEMHLKIDDYDNIIFEWIPYDQFDYFDEVGKGGFATVYSAIWKDGPLNYYKGLYERDNYKEVALKCIDNSHNITDEFLNEV